MNSILRFNSSIEESKRRERINVRTNIVIPILIMQIAGKKFFSSLINQLQQRLSVITKCQELFCKLLIVWYPCIVHIIIEIMVLIVLQIC